ncbi:transmembrane protein 106B-like [Anneissia japonica]|uniref:transmembrane protein 106B-like n=1 Tax=Anneissia japonica TaxID=1529436 RepID=UPI0014259BC9|nr:transmembrane protein 106B-like [Anneissia japonica]
MTSADGDIEGSALPVNHTPSTIVNTDTMSIPHINHTDPQISPNSNRMSSYEEFGGMPCPTCNGTGKIPRGQEGELVALIPYKDDRLKPRRTWMWVGLSILCCGVIAGILCFILIPRDIKMGEPIAETYRADLNKTTKILLIELNFMFNVSNENYVPVTVTEIDIEAQLMDQVIGKTQYNNSSKLHSRTTSLLNIPLNVSIDADSINSYILTICDPDAVIPYPHLLYLTFDVMLHTHLLNQDKENSLNTYPIHVSCVTPSHF